MAKDPEQLAHLEWLGYVQPVGLVVSIPALLAAQAHVNRNIVENHQRFLGCLPRDNREELIPQIRNLAEFTHVVLGWEPGDLVALPSDVQPLTDQFAALEIPLPEYHERLRPTHVVPEQEPKDPARPWLMLVQALPVGTDLDEVATNDTRNWQASPHAKFERLLRETEVPVGLLSNGTSLRLVYAPRGETSGYMTFVVDEMAKIAGRPIFAALHMLFSAERLFSLPEKQRLPAILADSRKYQNVVSTQLAEQVLAALYELVRGFQAADDQRHGELFREVLAEDPNHVYAGLLTVLMRLVFTLYAEDRGLLSTDAVFANFYSVTGLFDRLRADAGRYTDTMDQRYGAWAQLLTLFRLVYDGGRHGALAIPPRRGYLFDPDRYNFLEGRAWKAPHRLKDKVDVPHVSDGVIFRVLTNLLILDGERLSYRTLDVEQIGSVYETMMGFDLQVAEGRSIAVKPIKSHGAPATINLEALLATKPTDRVKWLQDQSDQKFTGEAAEGVKQAGSLDDLLSALEKKIARHATPNTVPKGAMVLQPSDERRRSGSHYTPRSLTEPIVRTTLRPILQQLGERPKPEQLLELKICDPAMGSAAFLVEACRQLGDELVKAWHVHDCVPKLPPDEDEILYARRLIAQRCLYGVDRNPMAVDLAKLSLWLATLAKDHPFTFLDHALRAGDSLVGLSREQIAAFHWQPKKQRDLFRDQIEKVMKRVTEFRQKILAARDDVPYEQLRQQLDLADEQLALARLAGDLIISAFFSAEKDKQRQQALDQLEVQFAAYVGPHGKTEDRIPLAAAVDKLHSGDRPISPFHWQIEFPEVFTVDAKGKPTGGFDGVVGNPPFAGKNTLINGNRDGYLDWLKALHEESHGNADLVAHFFRRAFNLLRAQGCFGLIATNTIGQGDTRSTGLRWICTHGGTIYSAKKRYRWPGQAAVIVSVVHICHGQIGGTLLLDGRVVPTITAYLFHGGGHTDPFAIGENRGKSFIGNYINGAGFTFDDSSGDATPLSEMNRLVDHNKSNAERIFPYLGGEEILNHPQHRHYRYVINFGEMTEDEALQWPDLMAIIVEKVKPYRLTQSDKASREMWWLFARRGGALQDASQHFAKVMVHPNLSNHLAFAFIPKSVVVGAPHNVLVFDRFWAFAVLQSRVHEGWARFFASSMKDDLRYTPSDCFETFPFPADVMEHAAGSSPRNGNRKLAALETPGREYYEFRAALMVCNNEGLTKTYNRFHDPNESSPEILKLRELHAAIDRAVLEAYDWDDLAQTATCEFLLDYDNEEDDDEPPAKGKPKKKPWRYRWPDEFRDEVLARLLELNKQRAEEERLDGIAAEAAEKAAAPAKQRGRKKSSKQKESLFD